MRPREIDRRAETLEAVRVPALLLRMRAPGLAGEEAPHHRREGLDRHGVVVWIKRHLVVLRAEVEAELVGGMPAVLLPRVPIDAEVMEIVVALEESVLADH